MRGLERPAPQAADEGGQQQAGGRQGREKLVDDHQRTVAEQIGREALLVGLLGVEEPPEVGVEHSLEQRPEARAVDPRRVRITLGVGEGVVAAVVGDPADHGALDRHASGDRQRNAQGLLGLERPVRQITVETDGDPVAGDRVEHHHQHDVAPVDPAVPQQRNGRHQGGQRNHDDHAQRQLLGAGLEAAAGHGRHRARTRTGGATETGRSEIVIAAKPPVIRRRQATTEVLPTVSAITAPPDSF